MGAPNEDGFIEDDGFVEDETPLGPDDSVDMSGDDVRLVPRQGGRVIGFDSPISIVGSDTPDQVDARPMPGVDPATYFRPGVDTQGHQTLASEAAMYGALDAGTLGFIDEIAGGVRSLAGEGSYEQERDAARQEMALSQAQHPLAYAGGELGATVITAPFMPSGGRAITTLGRYARTGAAGLGLGAITGAGHSTADDVTGVAGDTLTGAGVGLGTGLAMQGAGDLAGAGIRALARSAPARQAAADEARVLTAQGATGGTIARPKILRDIAGETRGVPRVPGGTAEVARVMRENGMAPRFGSTEAIHEGAQAASERSRQAIDAIIDAVGETGERVDTEAFAGRLEQEAAALAREPENFPIRDALLRKAEEYRRVFPDGMTIREAQDAAHRLGNAAIWAPPNSAGILPNARHASAVATRAIRSEMDSAVDRAFAGRTLPSEVAGYRLNSRSGELGSDAVNAYRGARRVSHVARIVEENAEQSLGRRAKNRLFGMGEQHGAQLGATVAGATGMSPAIGAAAGAASVRGAARFGATVRASAAESMARLAQRVPQMLPGRTAQALIDASRRGASAVAATHFVLSQQDPNYRAVADDLARAEEHPEEIGDQ